MYRLLLLTPCSIMRCLPCLIPAPAPLCPSPLQVYEALTPLAPKGFSVAAAFGNVHGVYSPGNVQLTPSILGNAQKFIKAKKSLSDDKPVFFVFHGGSGSSREEIREAISYGVVKMNIDTDTQVSMGPRGGC